MVALSLRLRPLTLLLALAPAVVAAAVVARADGPAATYDLHTWKRVWKAGDARTVRSRSTTIGGIKAEIVDPSTGTTSTQDNDLSKTEETQYVERCEATDAQGNPTAFRAFVADWSHSAGGAAPDTSLAGAHVAVAVQGATWSWKHLNPQAPLSEDAKVWLEKRFGAKRRGEEGLDLQRLGRPPAAVKVGASWSGSAASFLDEEVTLDLKRSKIDLRLSGVEQGAFTVPVTFSLQLAAFPLGKGGPSAPWTEGGAMEGAGEFTQSLAPHTFDAQGEVKATMRGKAALPGVLAINMDLRMHLELTVATGGAIPKLVPSDPPVTIDPPR